MIHCDGHTLISFVFPQFTSFHDKCILFPFNADFQAFSYRILPETSSNLSDEWLKFTHVNFIQRDSDAEPTRQLINIGSLMKNTANHNRANLGVLFLNQSGKKVRICPFYMGSIKGMFQPLSPPPPPGL